MFAEVNNEVANQACLQILARIDHNQPGFGEFPNFEGHFHFADAYGLIASSSVKLGRLDIAKRCIDWLVENSRLEKYGRPGWGLPFKYQTFGAEPNPVHTIYGITNAIVVQGLLDFWETTREDYALDCAVRALRAYTDFFDQDHFYYSPNESDNLMVPNVDAMLAGQYARTASHVCKRDAELFREISLVIYQNLTYQMLPDGSWCYVNGRAKKNDILHHAYILHGLTIVERELDLKTKINLGREYMSRFIGTKRVYELPILKTRRRVAIEMGIRKIPYARLWGIGAWLAASEGRQLTKPGQLVKILEKYRASDGRFFYHPDRPVTSVRHDAHLLWGLSTVGSLGVNSGIS
jgi:hypothetical protein